MARTSKKTTKKPPTGWRFVRYAERFGAGQAPQYLKFYVNAWDGDGGEVVEAMKELRAEQDFIWIQGAICELLTKATNITTQYQGYLAHLRQPAPPSRIGAWLGTNYRKADALLRKLERVGLMEKAPWPDAAGDPPAQEPDKPTRQTKQKRTVTTSGKAKQGAKKQSSEPKKAAKAFKEKVEGARLKENKESKEERQRPRARQQRRPWDPLSPQEFESRRQEIIGQLQAPSGQPQTTAKAPSAPTAAPPISPTNPDALGPPGQRQGPSVSLPDTRKQSGHIGDTVCNILAVKYGPEALRFADKVLKALRYPGTDYAEKQAERANFAMAYMHLPHEGFSADGIQRFEREYIRRMRKVGDTRSQDNPESYARKSFDNLVSSMRPTATPTRARASPG